MRKSTKGFYTVEAAIFLPLVLLSVLSLGFFMKVEGTWENCIHGAVDESMLTASKGYNETSGLLVGNKIRDRIRADNPGLKKAEVKEVRIMYRDLYADNITSYKISTGISLDLPIGFSREFEMAYRIKYRGFTGARYAGVPMGASGLESYEEQKPVWIFPHSGAKYHREDCTYVKASVEPVVLTSKIRKSYGACNICDSGNISAGTIVFCFKGEDTAYHRGTCSSIVRHTVVIDKSEAAKRGLEPCSKCGG